MLHDEISQRTHMYHVIPYLYNCIAQVKSVIKSREISVVVACITLNSFSVSAHYFEILTISFSRSNASNFAFSYLFWLLRQKPWNAIEKHNAEAERWIKRHFSAVMEISFIILTCKAFMHKFHIVLSSKIILCANENQRFQELGIAQPKPRIIGFCSGIKLADI